MRIKAYAKVNISLDVLSRRPDGYHDMLMVMQRVGVCDDIDIELSRGTGNVSLVTDSALIPAGDGNIAVRAARAYLEAAGKHDYDVRIGLHKVIPTCAGLGGGSADGAAVLEGMNVLFDGALSGEKLYELAEKLGSDVPFCLHGGTALVSGRGEKIEALPDFPHSWMVICKPEFSVSTPELFARIDGCRLSCRPDTEGLVAAIASSDLNAAAACCFNVFEEALPVDERSTVDAVKAVFTANGAFGATMSGTGSACFGIFGAEDKARAAYAELAAKYAETFIVEI